MTEDEVEVVAAELAKAAGVTWYPGRETGPLKLVMDRYRDRARLALAALERFRDGQEAFASDDSLDHEQQSLGTASQISPNSDEGRLETGAAVLYRPPGDRRAYPCRVEKIDGRRAYLVPDLKTCTGWVDAEDLSSEPASEVSKE